MSDTADNNMFISDRIEQWTRSPDTHTPSAQPKIWELFECHHGPSDKECTSDVFGFDRLSGVLVEVISAFIM